MAKKFGASVWQFETYLGKLVFLFMSSNLSPWQLKFTWKKLVLIIVKLIMIWYLWDKNTFENIKKFVETGLENLEKIFLKISFYPYNSQEKYTNSKEDLQHNIAMSWLQEFI